MNSPNQNSPQKSPFSSGSVIGADIEPPILPSVPLYSFQVPVGKFDYRALVEAGQALEREAQLVQSSPVKVREIRAPFSVPGGWQGVPGFLDPSWTAQQQMVLQKIFYCCENALQHEEQKYKDFLGNCLIRPYIGPGVEIVDGENRSTGGGHWDPRSKTLFINPMVLQDFAESVAVALHEIEHGAQGDRLNSDVSLRCDIEIRTHAATAKRLHFLAAATAGNKELSELNKRYWRANFEEQAAAQEVGAQSYRVTKAFIVPLMTHLNLYSRNGSVSLTAETHPSFFAMHARINQWHFGAEMNAAGAKSQAEIFNTVYALNQKLNFIPSGILDAVGPELTKLFESQQVFGRAFIEARKVIR